MKKILIALIAVMFASGCSTSRILKREYYPPTENARVEVKNESGEITDVKGAVKTETSTDRKGANEFSTGKSFELNVQGLSL